MPVPVAPWVRRKDQEDILPNRWRQVDGLVPRCRRFIEKIRHDQWVMKAAQAAHALKLKFERKLTGHQEVIFLNLNKQGIAYILEWLNYRVIQVEDIGCLLTREVNSALGDLLQMNFHDLRLRFCRASKANASEGAGEFFFFRRRLTSISQKFEEYAGGPLDRSRCSSPP